MDREWNDTQPIYRQLRDRVVAMILEGVLKEGDPLPSVRNVAAEYRVNPLTVLKGYQQLVDEGLVETRRGLGMFINAGARGLLLEGERQKFRGRIQRLQHAGSTGGQESHGHQSGGVVQHLPNRRGIPECDGCPIDARDRNWIEVQVLVAGELPAQQRRTPLWTNAALCFQPRSVSAPTASSSSVTASAIPLRTACCGNS